MSREKALLSIEILSVDTQGQGAYDGTMHINLTGCACLHVENTGTAVILLMYLWQYTV